MYIIRWNAKIKRGRMAEAIAFTKNAPNPPARIYANVFGDNDILVAEAEFDDIEAAARFVEWAESSETQAEVTDRGWYDISAGNVVELWKVID